MSLVDASLLQFLNNLAARTATPGGGSASAVGGAIGAALGSMAANYTIGNEKYQAFDAAARAARDALEELRANFMTMAEEDMAAYSGLRDTTLLPKQTPEERAARSRAMAAARERSTQAPERILSLAQDGLAQVEALSKAVNPGLAGDVASAAYFLEACARGAAIQVFSNCAAADSDGANARRRDNAERIVEKCAEYRSRIHAAVLGMLKIETKREN